MTFVANLSTLIDIAFVGFVSFACWKSMRLASAGAAGMSEAGRAELQELEKVLRSLIDEAGEASVGLERRLSRRKEEIEMLLKRAEQLVQDAPQQQPSSRQAPRNAAPKQRPVPAAETTLLELDDELPNTSWQTSRQPRGAQDPIETAAARQRDTVQLTKNTEEELSQAAQRTFAQLSITDPIAYKIARRLLSQGVEIHVVARKLDVPLSEIRVLDRLMREELVSDPDAVESNPYARRVEPVRESKIVRSKPQQGAQRRTTFDVELTERDEVQDEATASRISDLAYRIERGSALV